MWSEFISSWSPPLITYFSLSPSAEVAHQFQYAVRVIGSNYAPTIERDEFLVSEKIKKEREYDDTVIYMNSSLSDAGASPRKSQKSLLRHK